MAFFGLTSLGPQNTFQHAARSDDRSYLHLFSVTDFKLAYDQLLEERRTAAADDDDDDDGDETTSRRVVVGMRRSDVPQLLEIVYRGPAPVRDTARVTAALLSGLTATTTSGAAGHSCDDDDVEIQWSRVETELSALLTRSRHAAQMSSSSSKTTYSSYDDYRDASHRHVRIDKNPRDLLRSPLTSGQEFGWKVDEFRKEDFGWGKKSCPETRYANDVVKSGIIL
mmetsp:Transcript_55001/g.66240  ORF Transcript_55001/g.66240 Transcript_55001/m.66240 type:complete len:225 (+) Transcript_55001:96-770(+)|eukprot:CAMPEP_0172497642 /NCGR_PEP_ID=MMETSP1066-20121228/102696_1 /TAXON_ID=671091 /ORGANISM="Coscinodiscus wailesii, Strain CCMP2513" /LENGTH=224 /DNA_ID=CAMNT_0013270521 /DNA_START=93 /DNA_END=767 /DNA_ORIENTATION=+